MTPKEFEDFLTNELDTIREKLAKKGAEYAPEEKQSSRFHNFETAAALNGETMEKALWGFATKHIVSLSDMVNGKISDYPFEVWEEKIGDVTNYMLLLKSMIVYEFDMQKLVTKSFEESQKNSVAPIINHQPGPSPFSIHDKNAMFERIKKEN